MAEVEDNAKWAPLADSDPDAGWAGVGSLPRIPGFTLIDDLYKDSPGRVFLARQRSPDRDVVIKLLTHTDQVRRRREVQFALHGDDCSDIIRSYAAEIDKEPPHSYLIMEYASRGSLYDQLRRRDETEGIKFTVAEVVNVGLAVASALRHVHGLKPPLLHRDVKPGNIFQRRNGSYALGDFGISRLANTQRTHTANEFTNDFASLQMLMAEEPTPADDLWGLGATLYWLLDGGGRPFDQAADEQLPPAVYLKRMESADYYRPLARSDVTAKLQTLIAQLLVYESGCRPTAEQTFAELRLISDGLDQHPSVSPFDETTVWAPPAATGTTPSQGPKVSEDGEIAFSAVKHFGDLRVSETITHESVDGDAPRNQQPSIEREATSARRRRWRLAAMAATVLIGLIGGSAAALYSSHSPGTMTGSNPPASASGSPSQPAWAPELLTPTDKRSAVTLAWKDHSGGTATFVILFGSDTHISPYGHPLATGTTRARITGLDPAASRYCFSVLAIRGDRHAQSNTRCITRTRH